MQSGWYGLQRFSSMRYENSSSKLSGDSFYTITTDRHGIPSNAKLHEGVQKWIQELRQQPRCSDFIENFLDLVMGMLEVDGKKRLNAGQVNSELCQMIRAGKVDAQYYTQRNCKISGVQVIDLPLSDSLNKFENSTIYLNLSAGHPLPTS